jgi:hypothetical protein
MCMCEVCMAGYQQINIKIERKKILKNRLMSKRRVYIERDRADSWFILDPGSASNSHRQCN